MPLASWGILPKTGASRESLNPQTFTGLKRFLAVFALRIGEFSPLSHARKVCFASVVFQLVGNKVFRFLAHRSLFANRTVERVEHCVSAVPPCLRLPCFMRFLAILGRCADWLASLCLSRNRTVRNGKGWRVSLAIVACIDTPSPFVFRMPVLFFRCPLFSQRAGLAMPPLVQIV